jgi:neural Wiskott-Aldrich syndrome protein
VAWSRPPATDDEMSADPNKKSARNFQCRDVLWETFEQMARELECSVDYLINEAMKQYARQRSYGSRTPFPGRETGSPPPQQPPSSHGGYAPPQMNAPQMNAPQMNAGLRQSTAPPMPTSQRVPPPPARPPTGGGLGPPPARPYMQQPLPPQPQRPMTSPGRSVPPPPQPRSQMPPPIPQRAPTPIPPPMPGGGMGGMNGFPAPMTHGSQLSVIYQGEKVPVTKDRFVIGRGKQSSDLTLKDPNVSRQHAMIEFQNGVYFMVDMGSTNGVEYNGQRIARKQIGEGDVYKICDHEMRFTYR